MAEEPNQVWSYDVTNLKGPARGVHFDLFVMLDIYSRYCPGWMVVDQQDAQVAKAWLAEVIASQGIEPET
ncbi:MAG: integrase catalytic domain-containing protein, partial [Acidimicrobiales bacterium]